MKNHRRNDKTEQRIRLLAMEEAYQTILEMHHDLPSSRLNLTVGRMISLAAQLSNRHSHKNVG